MSANVIEHYTENGLEQDKLGFYAPKCSCGWQSPPAPDEETATDFLMQHAYEAGILTERNRRGGETQTPSLLERAEREPLGVDISDYSDEFCAGFLAGQQNALDYLGRCT